MGDQPDASGASARSPAPTSESVPPQTEPDLTPFTLEENFKRLSFGDFEVFNGTEAATEGAPKERAATAGAVTWKATDEGFSCTGKPRGYLYSKDSFQNFTLRYDVRFVRDPKVTDDSKFKGNTGLLVYLTGEHKLWPMSLEVQGKHVQLGAIKENGGAAAPTVTDDETARQQARKPVGQWNAMEVTSKDGALIVLLNGIKVATSEPNFLSAGSLGFQAEDHPFEVRRCRIRIEP